MWFTCNLRRHINSNHMDKTFNCTYCDKYFKRNDFNLPTVDTNPLYSGVATADAFLDSLVEMDSPPLPSSSTSAREVQDPPIAISADLVITQCSPHQSLNSLVTQGSQTEICALPPTRQWIHTGTNTTPKFTRDKSHQVAVSATEANTSPHILQVDYNPMQGWDSPLVSSPQTPDVIIPCYFMSAYQARRRELNLPEGVTYQGPMSNCDDENPLPPHLDNSPIAWANTPKPCESPKFQLLI